MDAVDTAQRGLASYGGFVRSQLRRYGVTSADLEDLTQEVWLIILARSPSFPNEPATRAWLSQVCRRVAAGQRRSLARTPVLRDERAPELPVDPEQNEQIELELDEQKSVAALAQLSEAQLDVLALYGSGDLSMREVAELLGEPEGTIYSRYRGAIEDVSRALRRGEWVGARSSASVSTPQRGNPPLVPTDREEAADRGELVFYRREERLVIGRIGNVVISLWRKRVFEQSTADVGAAIKMVAERLRAPVVMVNVALSDMALPNAKERATLRYNVHERSRDIVMAVDIVDIRLVRMLYAIVAGLLSITRSNRVLTFAVVPTVEEARRWLEPHTRTVDGPLSWERLQAAIIAVRDAR